MLSTALPEAFCSTGDAKRLKLVDSIKRQRGTASRLEAVEEEWMEVQEQLEALAQAD
ncbi:hypothetical protein [Chromobacterium sp. ATCC 53434]|uniref:hypothetical protein n=1 Tax=Chromobacterium sp. (strain ATCC 53434 / SC 14030) TaxID=2059672 RepID=UPI001305334A|nr:hypothetical protein [Chromobacterium sp. ATCC 53434]